MNKFVLYAGGLAVVWWAYKRYRSSRRYENHDHPILSMVRSKFYALNPAYANIPLQVADKSFTEGKQMIALCIRDPSTGIYYDENTITYVALHELAHVVNDEWGHGSEFVKEFDNILAIATSKGLYNPGKKMPRNYCGMR